LKIIAEISALKNILHDIKSAGVFDYANSARTGQLTTTCYKWESGIIYGKSKKREVEEHQNTQ